MKINKQIEEMAKVIADKTTLSIVEATGVATILTVEDYRKASDVAREIFEEMDNILLKCISVSLKQLDEAVRDNSHDGMIATTSASEVLKAMRLCIAKLQKKYKILNSWEELTHTCQVEILCR